ncbi:hypothetical protein TOPH_04088 [Tolypocladium ophioglossoides CBS 100239]|uniref:Uncharacterized protein n=1 Tax=Tolypocladium ophioglossoides (strain CBS 100239) TaxID=1163406 RepID=A0A0L0NAT2_TOLOC|nr:hypothetical protein TOPH_04088 [Tolypocladium ophioglossoides CBS 100239]
MSLPVTASKIHQPSHDRSDIRERALLQSSAFPASRMLAVSCAPVHPCHGSRLTPASLQLVQPHEDLRLRSGADGGSSSFLYILSHSRPHLARFLAGILLRRLCHPSNHEVNQGRVDDLERNTWETRATCRNMPSCRTPGRMVKSDSGLHELGQELIAHKVVQFCDQSWNSGTSAGDVLRDLDILSTLSVTQRVSWAATNKGLREDGCYLLKLNSSHEAATRKKHIGIWIKYNGGGVYTRARPAKFGVEAPGEVANPHASSVRTDKHSPAARTRHRFANAFSLGGNLDATRLYLPTENGGGRIQTFLLISAAHRSSQAKAFTADSRLIGYRHIQTTTGPSPRSQTPFE